MSNSNEKFDVGDFLDKKLIDLVRARPSLYYVDVCTESDEKYWDEIGKATGMQKSWLKKRWKSIRDEHRKIILYNHIHGNKVPPHRLAKCLSFLKIDLNGANEMNFEDFNRPKKESFCITQEMLDDCDISESVTHESISIPKLNKIETVAKIHKIPRQSETQDADRNLDAKSSIEAQTERKNAPAVSENKELNGTSQNKYETESSSLDTNKRCEDTIFGELVAAMLKKMNPDEKKRAKKEIMNILL